MDSTDSSAPSPAVPHSKLPHHDVATHPMGASSATFLPHQIPPALTRANVEIYAACETLPLLTGDGSGLPPLRSDEVPQWAAPFSLPRGLQADISETAAPSLTEWCVHALYV